MMPTRLILIFLAAFTYTACSSLPSRQQEAHNYQAHVVQEGLEISENGKLIVRIKTALPNVEDWKFVEEGGYVITKSRGSHGPASVEKFESRTGILRDKVLAYAIRNGEAEWAKGFED